MLVAVAECRPQQFRHIVLRRCVHPKQTSNPENQHIFSLAGPLPKGLYLQAFCEGIDDVLLPFRDAIADLETRYLQTPTHSLMFVYDVIKSYQPLFSFLLRFIDGVRQQRLHGCALLSYMHRHTLHGNRTIADAVQSVQLSVHRVLLKQLTQWMMYGRFHDAYQEFFIRMIEQPPHRSADGDSGAGVRSSSGEHNGTFNSSQNRTNKTAALAHNADLWRYEIDYDLLPPYFTPQWAEKVRFIGQTVVTFNLDPTNDAAEATTTASALLRTAGGHHNRSAFGRERRPSNDTGDVATFVDQPERTLWNDQQHVHMQALRAICAGDRLQLHRYEPVIDDIKVYVSGRLSEIAIQQADLVRQLRLIKDFYLLGRGEFYLEFIKQTRALLERSVGGLSDGHVINEMMAKDITTAFSTAALNINVTDDLEQFQLTVQLDGAGAGSGTTSLDSSLVCPQERAAAAAAASVVGFIPNIALHYRVPWPLHLLFSPRIIDGYNEMFRFLLQIKRIQYQLQLVWCDHRERRVGRDSRMLQLRNKLMFVVNNLQYYLQVDVLEAQFGVLMQTVQESRDFEHIQRAHTVFQANVLSLCFLLAGHEPLHQQTSNNQHYPAATATAAGSVTMAAAMLNRTDVFGTADNPVLIILNKIMQRVLIFCELSMKCAMPLTEEEQRSLRYCDEMFDGHVAELMRLLTGMRAGPSSAPLAQLLLRLDYNYWFSSKTEEPALHSTSQDEEDGRRGGDEADADEYY